MENITRKELESLEKKGLVVHIYRNKKMACVSGFQYYKIKN